MCITIFISFHIGFDAENAGSDEIRFAFGPPPPLRFHAPIIAIVGEPEATGRGLGKIVGGRNALVLRKEVFVIVAEYVTERAGQRVSAEVSWVATGLQGGR